MAAIGAAQAQEAVRQDAALQERVELVFDELRQAGTVGLFGLGEEALGVLLHQAVQRGLLGSVALVVDRGAIAVHPAGLGGVGLHALGTRSLGWCSFSRSTLQRIRHEKHGVDMLQACWLAFGSEGRSEQTLSTDQDNGLVFVSDDAGQDRPRWLTFARDVNEALDRCGYPLCKGNITASNPDCCLRPNEWIARFDRWMEYGAPQDLLNANIYFGLRALVGRADLAEQLRMQITRQASALPRLAKQMADNALPHRVPLNWRGAIDTETVDGREMVDLKHHGTVVFVDVSRICALALGVTQTGTRERIEAFGPLLHMSSQECDLQDNVCPMAPFVARRRPRIALVARGAGLRLPLLPETCPYTTRSTSVDENPSIPRPQRIEP